MTASERINADSRPEDVPQDFYAPLDALRYHVTGAVERGEAEPIVEKRCYCPDDCNCHYPHRTNFCGCKQHETL